MTISLGHHLGTYPRIPGHRGIDTSVAAAEKIADIAGPLRRMVYKAIFEAGASGLTTDEIADTLTMPRYSVQPRTTELKHDRRIRDSGKRRHNASGCRAIVWVAVANQERAA
jgi:hypothetical protein